MCSSMMDLLRFSFLRKRKIFNPHFNVPANAIGCEILPIYFRLLPPQGFGPEAKTRGGTLGFPGCIYTRTKNICC